MLQVSSFTFGTYSIDAARGIVSFTYRVTFSFGVTKTFSDAASPERRGSNDHNLEALAGV